MKINDLNPIQQPGKKPEIRKQPATDFKNVLSAHLESLSPPQAAAAVPKTSPAGPASASLRVEGLQITENTLNTLASFSKALANPALDPEDLEPFASAMEEETSALLSIKHQLSPDDPLARLLDRVATVSFLESTKYRRGDYTA